MYIGLLYNVSVPRIRSVSRNMSHWKRHRRYSFFLSDMKRDTPSSKCPISEVSGNTRTIHSFVFKGRLVVKNVYVPNGCHKTTLFSTDGQDEDQIASRSHS